MGVLDKLHGPLFHAIHDAQTVPISNASADELATFVRGEGIDADRFKAAMASPEVDALMQRARDFAIASGLRGTPRSEEHTSELQSLMRISFAVFCLKTKKRYNMSSEDS